MNYYQKAIEQNEIIAFFRGVGEYFEADLDREGTHDFSFTSYNIMGYGLEYGEEELYKHLNNDLLSYINIQYFTLRDLKNILGLIWVYNLFRNEDHAFKTDWIIPKQLIKIILDKIKYFELNGEDLSTIHRTIDAIKNRFGFDLLKLSDNNSQL